MYEIFSRRKLTNVKEIYIYVDFFYSENFLLYRKDEIERLRKDFGQMQRSVAAAPPVTKPVAQQDIDYVCIN